MAINKVPLNQNELKRFHSLKKTKEWREANPQNKMRYEEHLRKNRESKKLKRIKKAAATDLHLGLQKRAIDLNKSPEPEPESPPSNGSFEGESTWKRKDSTQPELPNMPKKRLRRDPTNEKERQKWKEAQKNPSKMTPQIQKRIDAYQNRKLNSRQSYASLMERVRKGEELTPQQQKRFTTLFRKNEWKEANRVDYDQFLKKKRETYRHNKNLNPEFHRKYSHKRKANLTAEQNAAKSEANKRYYKNRMTKFKEA